MSWISLPKAETGNPIGIGSNYTLSGSGELDNGWSVALSIAATNKMAYSTTNVTVTVPSLGDLIVTQGGTGKGIDRMDDVTPNVWEEAYGTGLSNGIQTVNGSTTGAGIEWTPNMMPDGLTARLFYSPDVTGAGAADKGASGSAINSGSSGWDLTLVADSSITGMEGLTIGGGYATFDRTSDSDASDQTVYATYAIGGFTVGYQWSEADLGTTTGAQQYDNDGYGITFAVNDDLSIGYNHYESEQDNGTAANVTTEATSMQIAYSMGGASVRLASSDGENMAYQTGVDYDRDSTVLSVSLAF
jgi:outer membrane protein OmpU